MTIANKIVGKILGEKTKTLKMLRQYNTIEEHDDRYAKKLAKAKYKEMIKTKRVTVKDLSLIHAYIDYKFDPNKYNIEVDDSEERMKYDKLM